MGKDAPEAPDPYAVAQAQSKSNKETAQEQARLAMTGQVNPFGSISYVRDPSSPSGYRQVTELSPEQQALLQQSQDLTAQYGGNTAQQFGLVSDALNRAGTSLSQPFDLNAARGTEISDMQKTFLDPQWDQRSEALRTQLLNRGIRDGSQEYDTAMRQFGQQRDDAYSKMYLDAYQLGNNTALTQRNLPLSDLQALWGGQQPTPNPTAPSAPTPTPGVAATDVAGPVMQGYQTAMNSYNNNMGGLFGLGSAALGGWAKSGFAGAGALFSDRRLKTEVTKLGDDPRGWGVYRYQYNMPSGEMAGWHIGYMADEVEKIRPDAVHLDSTGFKKVDYAKLNDSEREAA